MPVYHQTCFKLNIVFSMKWVIKEDGKYLQGPSMLESTSDRDTGRRTWHLPCLFWLSGPHRSMYRLSGHQHYLLSQQQLSLSTFQMFKWQHLQGVRRRVSPWCVYCWGRNVEPLVLRCGGKPCRWRCQVQTLRLDFGPRRELTMQKGDDAGNRAARQSNTNRRELLNQ